MGKVMVLADWLTPDQQQAALLHELAHARQDREMSLDQFLAPTPGRGDQLLARQALIEGEAVALSLEIVLKAHGLALEEIPDLSSLHQLAAAQSAGAVFDRAPKFLREQLLFPYTKGLQFVHQFRRRETWSALGRLYRDPPRSTAQILHPATLLDQRQDPVPVALPDLGSMLPAGWYGDRYQVWEAGRDQLLVCRKPRPSPTRMRACWNPSVPPSKAKPRRAPDQPGPGRTVGNGSS